MKNFISKVLTCLIVTMMLTFSVVSLVKVNAKTCTGTINFGSASGSTSINAASVTGDDSLDNTWTITTVGTTSYTSNTAYYQVGSSAKPATSITFTTTLPEAQNITAFSAKFGGFSGTAGTITLKVGETTVGTGSLKEANDVTVSSASTASGTVLTVTVTGIAKGVKCYYISYSYNVPNPTTGISIEESDLELFVDQEYTLTANKTPADSDDDIEWSSDDPSVATVDSNGKVTGISSGTATITATSGSFSDTCEVTVSEPIGIQDNLNLYESYFKLSFSYRNSNDFVSDNLTAEKLKLTTGYNDFSDVSDEAGAIYAGNAMKNSANHIQLKSNDSISGIVTTQSAGYVKKIKITWDTSTTANRTVDIYGKNSAYTTAADLYSNATKGTKIGSLVYGGESELIITGEYEYFGLRSNTGALYIENIEIVWSASGNDEEYKDVSCKLLVGVNTSVGDIDGVESYGLKVTDGTRTEYFASNNSGMYEATNAAFDGNTIRYMILDLCANDGDVINNISRAKTNITIAAYAEDADERYVSTNTKTYSVASLVKYYYDNRATLDEESKAAIIDFYKVLVAKGAYDA